MLKYKCQWMSEWIPWKRDRLDGLLLPFPLKLFKQQLEVSDIVDNAGWGRKRGFYCLLIILRMCKVQNSWIKTHILLCVIYLSENGDITFPSGSKCSQVGKNKTNICLKSFHPFKAMISNITSYRQSWNSLLLGFLFLYLLCLILEKPQDVPGADCT